MQRETKRQAEAVPQIARRAPGVPAVTHTPAPKGRVVRPGHYADGQQMEGTPAGVEHSTARTQRHRDGDEYRAGNRGEPIPTAPRGR